MKSTTWIWRNLRIGVPEGWEMLQFTRNPANGRCAFADRYGFRLELAWRAVPGPPDFDRMLGDYEARLREQGYTELRRERRAAWHGIAGVKDGRCISRFGAFFDRESCVVELVFIGADERDPALEKSVLASVREEPPDARKRRRWRGFGAELRVAPELHLAYCRIDPGEAFWRFADERERRQARFRRIGLRHVWMRAHVPDWLRENAPALRQAREEAIERCGHTAYRRTGRLPRGWLQRLFRGPVGLMAEAWVCPADDRLYYREVRGPPRFVEEETRDGGLCCLACGGADA